MEKFFIVVRDDLDPGLACAQVGHAAYMLGVYSPRKTRRNIAVLHAPRAELERFCLQSEVIGCVYEPFYEPDLNDEITAVAFGEGARKLLRALPPAFKDVRLT